MFCCYKHRYESWFLLRIMRVYTIIVKNYVLLLSVQVCSASGLTQGRTGGTRLRPVAGLPLTYVLRMYAAKSNTVSSNAHFVGIFFGWTKTTNIKSAFGKKRLQISA